MTTKTESFDDQLAAATNRLRVVDSYGLDWWEILRDKDTDPQMAKDCVTVVRAFLNIREELSATKQRDALLEVCRNFVASDTQWQASFQCMLLERILEELKDVVTVDAMTQKTDDAALIAALRILARDLSEGHGEANLDIAKAADRLEELTSNPRQELKQ